MDQQALITSLVLFLSPILGILLTMTDLLNVGKKELGEFFDKIQTYIHKRKVENLSKIIDPSSAGLLRDGDLVEVNTDALKSLSKEIDVVSSLEKCLFSSRKYCRNFYYSLLFLIFLGVLYGFLTLLKIKITFIESNFIVVNILIVGYVFFGFFFLSKKRDGLDTLYSKEYDI